MLKILTSKTKMLLLKALAFLPKEDVMYAYKELKENLLDQEDRDIAKFISYFEPTWIGIYKEQE